MRVSARLLPADDPGTGAGQANAGNHQATQLASRQALVVCRPEQQYDHAHRQDDPASQTRVSGRKSL
jgi:hypothetical protein